MAKKQNPLLRLKKNKTGIAFAELMDLLKKSGYAQQSIAGSHYVFAKAGHLPIMIVKPHGNKKHCHPIDVNKVIKVLETQSNA